MKLKIMTYNIASCRTYKLGPDFRPVTRDIERYAEAMKEQYSASYATDEQNRLILEYDNETCVDRYQKTYQDLLDLDK